MSNQKPIKLVQVSNVSALMQDGTQLSWIAYRPASAPAGSKPTLYVVTLPANLAEDPLSSFNLQVVGAQGTDHPVEVKVRDNKTATFYIPGQAPITP
ncbi:MAG TPA: hypothetical protein VHF69_11565, partial [Candidatus Synoicihabitans sp.]|nr:hypothetical protein [Candidatus Synoicihabitans sp.]